MEVIHDKSAIIFQSNITFTEYNTQCPLNVMGDNLV